jgi:pyruvate formate lyase activating enzyme
MASALAAAATQHTRPALLGGEPDASGRIACRLCPHLCELAEGETGRCGVRRVEDGQLVTLVYGSALALYTDPVEKKPFYHVLPGARTLSVATGGCSFRCSFCQNWQVSQAFKLPELATNGRDVPPEALVGAAISEGARALVYTYSEPTLFIEYALAAARLGAAHGLLSLFKTNGFLTQAAVDLLAPYIAAANVDLKAFDEKRHRSVTGAPLAPVLEGIRMLHAAGVWVEVATVVIPGVNDSDAELAACAAFIASVSPQIPWHINRFHPDWKMRNIDWTPPETMRRAVRIGRAAGLRYVYTNLHHDPTNNTHCAACGALLIERDGCRLVASRLVGGACPECGEELPGLLDTPHGRS